jgi:hypothetical protein
MKHICSICVLFMLISLTGCYTPEPGNPSDLFIREGTVAVFNTDTLDPKFNVATFQFPASYSSSGNLPNDSKFSKGPWEFSEEDFPLPDYTTKYRFIQPPNSIQVGDFLVDSIFLDRLIPQNSSVFVQMKGKFTRLNVNLGADDANVFEQWIASQRNLANADLICKQLKEQAKKFGDNDLGSRYSIIATHPDPGFPAYTYPNNWPSAKQIGQFLPPFKRVFGGDLNTYITEFKLGEVFYYEAVNGVNFYVLVSNLREGVLSPQLERATFKFSEAINCIICNPL